MDMDRLKEVLSTSTHLKVDSVVTGLSGLFLFVAPSTVVNLILAGPSDGVQYHLARCIGAQLLAGSFVLYKSSESPNGEFHTSCLVHRLLLSGLTIAMVVHARALFAKYFASFFFRIILSSSALTVVTSLYQLIKSGLPVGTALGAKHQFLATCLVYADQLMAMLIGCCWMAFPDWILKRQVTVQLNGSHLLLGRLLGVCFAASGVLSSHAPYFASGNDRQSVAIGRTIMCVGITLAQVWSQVAYHDDWTGKHWVGIGLCSLWTASSIFYTVQMLLKKFL